MSLNPPTDQPSDGSDEIHPISIVDEMKTSYLDYAMSVIVSRALPDVRDGLKPVHRRILFSCHENGYLYNKPYRKSARIVGDVIGKYHPHGDSAIYDALVRMAQDFSMRLPLIDGQGNFGSMDDDPPAAMRYTEARLAQISDMILADLDKDTVSFQENYDASEQEPVVLPARFPNLLVNGVSGIAVGMATNIPPHNLGEVIDACIAMIDDPTIDSNGLLTYIQGPDFPTSAIVLGRSGIAQAYRTGRGSITLRSRTEIEQRGNRQAIIISEIPYQVNKAQLVEKIAEAVKDKRIEGISDLRDESNREGVRVYIELKRDAVADVVLNQLYRFTPVQTSYAINMLAINDAMPKQMSLAEVIAAFLDHRRDVITRRSKFELGKARDRAHILLGLAIAVGHLDEVVAMIRGSSTPAEARDKLLGRKWPIAEVLPYLALISGESANDLAHYKLSETQVKAILDLRLQKLTAIGREEISDEQKKLADRITDLLDILGQPARLSQVMRDELQEIREKFADPRRTEILAQDNDEIEDEDLIQREDMVVTVTISGYIKRVPLFTYRAQKRGGKGRSGMAMKDEDILSEVFVASTHTPVLFFSDSGQVYRMKVWKLPEGTPQSKGKALVNLLPLAPGEKISTILPLPEDESSWGDLHVIFATAQGQVRRNAMDSFTNIPSNGKIAIRFNPGSNDRLIGVALCEKDDDCFLVSRQGKSIRFPIKKLRVFQSRSSTGVRGMTLARGDDVISLTILRGQDATVEEREEYLRAAPWKSDSSESRLSGDRIAELHKEEQFILTLTENGYGKRTSAYEYRTSGRGGQGVAAIDCSKRNGFVIASFPVEPDDQIIMVTDKGQLIRTPVTDIRIAGRATQGVTLFDVSANEHIVSVAHIREDDTDGDNEDSVDDCEDD